MGGSAELLLHYCGDGFFPGYGEMFLERSECSYTRFEMAVGSFRVWLKKGYRFI